MASKNRSSIQVIIPSLTQNNHLIRVLYCLSVAGIKNVMVVSAVKNDPIKYSFNLESFHHLPFSDDDDWIDTLKRLIKSKENTVLLPVDYYSIEFISRNKNRLEKFLDRILVPDLGSLKIANDKGKLAEFLDKEGIATPETILADSKYSPATLKYPLLFKPRIQCGGTGIKVCKNDLELQKIKKSIPDSFKSGILQHLIKGQEYGANLLAYKGNLLNYSIQKDISYSNKPFSPAQEIQFIQDLEIQSIIESLVQKLDWSGVAHVDLIYDEREKIFRIIEINPRFWLSLEGSLKAGINFPELVCIHTLNLPYEKPSYKKVSYIMNGGLFSFFFRKIGNLDLKNMVSTKSSINRIISDPLPKIASIINGAQNISNDV